MKVIVTKLVFRTSKLLLGSTESVHEGIDCIVQGVIFLAVKGGPDVVDEYLVVFVAVFSLQMFPELLCILFVHKVRQGGTNTFGYGVVDDLYGSVSAYFPVFAVRCVDIRGLFNTLNNFPSIGDDEGVLTCCCKD